MSSKCSYGHGYCTAPNTICPHWQGTFCELDYNIMGRIPENEVKKSCSMYGVFQRKEKYELKNCPFCGGDAEKRYLKRKKLFASIRFPYTTHYVYVRCKVCGATSSVHFAVENATDAWNRRISNG